MKILLISLLVLLNQCFSETKLISNHLHQVYTHALLLIFIYENFNYIHLYSIKDYQECRTPNGMSGHCKHYQHCSFPGIKQNFLAVLDYLCIIEQS